MWHSALILAASAAALLADQNSLIIQAKDIHGHKIGGLQIAAGGSPLSAPSDARGIAFVPITPEALQAGSVSLRLAASTQDWVFFSV